ncbi:MAG: ABC transporter permease [Spirochaetales bacterium]|nr:ABC transporter permease [Spirochaetales bacterium]
MNVSEGLRESIEVIRTNKVRSFLTILGINFGVGCLIAISIVGLAFRESISSEMGRYGSTLLWVQVNHSAYAGDERRVLMDSRDIAYFNQGLPGVVDGESLLSESYPVAYQGESVRTSVMGVEPIHFSMFDVKVAQGRLIMEEDLSLRRRVCVLRPDIAAKLFREEDPLGKNIRIDERTFTVIGVTERQTGGFLSDGSDNNSVFIPADFIASRYWGGDTVRYWIYLLQFETPEDVEMGAQRIQAYLEKRYGDLRGEDRFRIQRLDSFIAMTDRILNIISTLVLVIASISIVVGGLGIMNIMLVAVTERTREIGVRMAVGATRGTILLQFVIEAISLCLIGGGIGILFGSSLAALVCSILKWRFVVSFGIIMIALGISTVIGMTFGIYPAYKASKLTPVEALRAEH